MNATRTSKAGLSRPPADGGCLQLIRKAKALCSAGHRHPDRANACGAERLPSSVVGHSGQNYWAKRRGQQPGPHLSSARGQVPAPHGFKFLHLKLNPGNLAKRRRTAGPPPGATPSELEALGPGVGPVSSPGASPGLDHPLVPRAGQWPPPLEGRDLRLYGIPTELWVPLPRPSGYQYS